jgi:hypothetical protein
MSGERVSDGPLNALGIVGTVLAAGSIASGMGVYITYQEVTSSNWTCPNDALSFCCSGAFVTDQRMIRNCSVYAIQQDSFCVAADCTSNCAFSSSTFVTTTLASHRAEEALGIALLCIGGVAALFTIYVYAECKSRRPNR